LVINFTGNLGHVIHLVSFVGIIYLSYSRPISPSYRRVFMVMLQMAGVVDMRMRA